MKQSEKHNVNYNDKHIQKHFEKFQTKIQMMFSQNHRSRHIIFTQSDIRTLYILYLSKIHEASFYKNHQCHLCIIYDKEKIVSMDINTFFPSDDMVKTYMKHAEINAILNMKKMNTPTTYQGCGMFITRFTKTGVLNYSNPCFFCARFIKKHLYYFHSISFTDKDERIVVLTHNEFKEKSFNHKTQRYKGIVY